MVRSRARTLRFVARDEEKVGVRRVNSAYLPETQSIYTINYEPSQEQANITPQLPLDPRYGYSDGLKTDGGRSRTSRAPKLTLQGDCGDWVFVMERTGNGNRRACRGTGGLTAVLFDPVECVLSTVRPSPACTTISVGAIPAICVRIWHRIGRALERVS